MMKKISRLAALLAATALLFGAIGCSDSEESGNDGNNGDGNEPGQVTPAPDAGGSSESFLVPDEAKTDEIEAEAAVVDNALFTITSDGKLAYSIGKDASAGVPNTNKAISVTLLDGTTKTFKQGIKQGDATDPDGTTQTKKILVKAKEAIALRVYIALANDSFNSDRKGKIYYAIGSGEAESKTVTKRTEVQSIEVNLAKDETLEVYAIIDKDETTDSNGKLKNTAKLWLFGAEAKKQ
ncbi:MAG: hypothetical protein HDR38_08800 [Treponema sp.]|nr:hypothetical protein [Treponema sp.]